MLKLNFHPSGRHFLQIPGPSPVPDRILRAMSLPTIDHRGPEFAVLGHKVLGDLKKIFKTRQPVIIYPASGTGAWEAALANVLSPGDHVLMYESGQFATLWQKMANKLQLTTEFVAKPGIDAQTGLPNSWRHGVDASLIETRLAADKEHRIKAVCIVHNETSTGVTSDIAAVDGRYDLWPCVCGLSPRRMGRRRRDQRFAKGTDAAAGDQLQRAFRSRDCSVENCQDAKEFLGLG
jgi:alanine-glyoxylate transaminase / serine-glyoxylate transaminase / serine-pyruvate transaminase